jgi:hypothetical protein
MSLLHVERHIINVLQTAAMPCLWIASEDISTALIDNLRPIAGLEIITNRYDIATTLQAREFTVHLNDFDFSLLPVNHFKSIVFAVCKERSVVNHCINHAHQRLAAQGCCSRVWR